MDHPALLALALAALVSPQVSAAPGAAQIEGFFRPFAKSNNFSGTVLIVRGDSTLFAASYGDADRGRRIPNARDTRFHIASLSILFTSTAALRLIDEGKLSFDTRVSEIVPGVPNGDAITIRHLLEQNSGLPDANDDLPDYDELLKAHQTPESLVAAIRKLPPAHAPGGKSLREEHSGQNLLALIVERKTGLPFAAAMGRLVFEPFGMRDSGVDDDGAIEAAVARGYQVAGTFGLKPAPAIHWSAKPGNGSAYTTASDVWTWLRGVVHGHLLSDASRRAMLETEDGFGWWTSASERLGESVYIANGRAPGFSSRLEYLPNEDLAVIVLSNIEHDANPLIVPEVAAMVMGKSYRGFPGPPVSFAVSGRPAGDFVFGPDFYRPSATLRLVSDAGGVTLNWPGGPAAPLLPLGKDKFIDRYYWNEVTVVRGADGAPVAIDYGKYRGARR